MFAFLLVVIVIPFVFSFGPGSTFSRTAGHSTGSKTFFGHDLSNEAHMQEVARMAVLEQWLRTGQPPQNSQELQVALLERIVKADMVERLGIPSPTPDQLTVYIAGLPPFLDAKGFFSKAKFNEFETRLRLSSSTIVNFSTYAPVERSSGM